MRIKKYTAEKGDSTTSNHYWQEEDTTYLTNVKSQLGPHVTLLNNASIQASKQLHLPLNPSLTTNATSVDILLSLKSALLISLGQLFDVVLSPFAAVYFLIRA